jgi:hypothetical protein
MRADLGACFRQDSGFCKSLQASFSQIIAAEPPRSGYKKRCIGGNLPSTQEFMAIPRPPLKPPSHLSLFFSQTRHRLSDIPSSRKTTRRHLENGISRPWLEGARVFSGEPVISVLATTADHGA